MNLEQLIAEQRKVAPADFPEWRVLRAEFINALSADEKDALVAARFPNDDWAHERPQP